MVDGLALKAMKTLASGDEQKLKVVIFAVNYKARIVTEAPLPRKIPE